MCEGVSVVHHACHKRVTGWKIWKIWLQKLVIGVGLTVHPKLPLLAVNQPCSLSKLMSLVGKKVKCPNKPKQKEEPDNRYPYQPSFDKLVNLCESPKDFFGFISASVCLNMSAME